MLSKKHLDARSVIPHYSFFESVQRSNWWFENKLKSSDEESLFRCFILILAVF